MKSYFKLTIIFLFALGFFLLQTPSSYAGWEHNIRGEAYTAGDDFIYFNCLDEPSGGFPYKFTFRFGGNPCEVEHDGIGEAKITNYGVHLDYSTFVFRGHALHEKHGLISFENGPKGGDYDFLNENNCPDTTQSDCQEVNCSACYNIESQRIHGWAFVVSDNDWIRLDNENIDGIDRIGLYNYDKGDEAGDFYGYFYHETWGSIDLNECYLNASCNPNNPKHKVYVGKVELAKMTAPHWPAQKACETTAKGAILRWLVHGGYFNRYEIKIHNEDDFEGAHYFSLEHGDPGFNRFQTTIGQHGFDYDLDWNTPYYWWLKLHDDDIYSTSTEWIKFDHSDSPGQGVQGSLSDELAKEINDDHSDGNDFTFTTYKHEWPRPYFTWDGHPDNKTFQAGAPNEFWVTNDARHFSSASPYTPINFDDPSFDGEFLWWGTIDGIESDKITIVDLSEFPEGKEPYFRLDATTISSTIENIEDRDKINQWNDETGNDNHVKQNDEDKRPIYKINALNGRPAVYFDGSSFMTNDDVQVDEQPFTIFVVAKSDDDLNGAYLLDSLNEDNISLGYKENKWLMFAGESLISSDDINHKLSIWRAFYSGEVSALKIIHETEEDPNVLYPIDEGDEEFTNIIEGISIGASKEEGNYWQGYIGEIIIYDELLNANERKAIEEYLSLKWGIDEKEDATSAKVYVYFESVEDNQQVWLKLTDPTGYYCSTSTPYLTVDFELPIWREIKAR